MNITINVNNIINENQDLDSDKLNELIRRNEKESQ